VRIGLAAKEATDLQGDVFVDRARMRLFFGNAKVDQLIQDQVSFNLHLPRQLINADLLHK